MPLHYAIELHDVELVRHILDLATDSSRGTCSNQSAHHDDFIRKMLNACDGTGNSALHMASSRSLRMKPDARRRLIQLLLGRGADPSAKNREGQLPRELTTDQTVTIKVKSDEDCVAMFTFLLLSHNDSELPNSTFGMFHPKMFEYSLEFS